MIPAVFGADHIGRDAWIWLAAVGTQGLLFSKFFKGRPLSLGQLAHSEINQAGTDLMSAAAGKRRSAQAWGGLA